MVIATSADASRVIRIHVSVRAYSNWLSIRLLQTLDADSIEACMGLSELSALYRTGLYSKRAANELVRPERTITILVHEWSLVAGHDLIRAR